MSNLWTPGGEVPLGGNPLGGLGNINTEGPTAQIGAVTTALNQLKSALRDTAWYSVGNSITSMLESISRSAKATAADLGDVNMAVSRTGGAGGGAAAPTGGGGNANWLGTATSSASAATAAAAGAGVGGGMAPAGVDVSGQVFSTGRNLENEDLMKSMALFPLRFMRSMIDMNRGNALTASSALGMQGYATGVNNANQMTMLSRLPGNVRGTQADILSLFANAPQYGAMFGMGAQQNAPRTTGYLESVRQMQAMNPGAPVAELAGTVGGFASNVAAAQQSQMMTGGAYSMIRPGGGMKTVQEWAESILRWLEGLRGGGDRGKPFSYGDLISQYFPGSNIDAWFEVQGVPQNMREYFWTYALGKTKGGGGSTDPTQKIGADTSSIAYQRLAATTSMTQSQFKLGGQMAGAYANREQANRWFNDLLGSFLNRVIPSAVSSGAMRFAQFLPDTIEQTLMTIIENSGTLGTIFGAYAGYGGIFGGGEADDAGAANGMPDIFGPNSALNQPLFGDVPDIGDQYTTTGGTGTSGLHPDMRRKVNAMMKANPRLRVNSGLRDNAMQQRLKRRGVGRVSGRPSAHTRGMAADLGPASQYSWIVKNANKFGLNSGVSQGEPWHVGMGDLDDLFKSGGTFISDIMMGLKGLFTGSDPASGVAGIISPFFELLGGLLASGETNAGALAFQENVYERMHGATSGGVSLGGGLQSFIKKTIQGSASWLTGAGAGAQGAISSPGGPLPSAGGTTPNAEANAFVSNDAMTRGVAVVKALHAAGFRKSELGRMAAISWHESNWTPSAWVNDDDDIGGGLFGINQRPYIIKGMIPPWTKAEIQDPYRSAQIAYSDFYIGRGYQPWTTRNKPLDMGEQARKLAGLGDTEGTPVVTTTTPPAVGTFDSDLDDLGRQAASYSRQTRLGGVGDIQGMDYASMVPTPASSVTSQSLITFNNTFTISGGGIGGGGGIDLRRTVSTIADHLETEMKQRMVRMN